VNTTLTSLQSALKIQQSLVTQNNQLISELQNLNGNIELTRDAIVTKMQETTDKVSASNKALTDAVSKGLANEITGQNKRVMTQLNTIEANTMEAINNMATGMDDGRQLNAIYTRQGELLELLNKMMSQNMIIMQQIETNKNSITFP